MFFKATLILTWDSNVQPAMCGVNITFCCWNEDIVELAKKARAAVFEKFGIKLQAEVQLVGLDLN